MYSDMEKTYLLVIKRGKNDYLSVEWNLLKSYAGENIYTLEGIDNFTRKMYTEELIAEVLKENIVSPEERFQSFSIIYRQNGKTHEIKEGTIFKENTNILSEDGLIGFIIENIDNKQLLNEIYNLLNFKDKEEKLEEFKFILKNIDLFKNKSQNAVLAALSQFKFITYEKKRNIIMRTSEKVVPKIEQNNQNKSLTNQKKQSDYKVA